MKTKLEIIRDKIKCVPDNFEEKDIELILNDSTIVSLCYSNFFDYLIELFYYLEKNNIQGDIAEVGVWKGGSAAFLEFLIEQNNLKKKLFLFDTFEGFKQPNSNHTRDSQSFLSYNKLHLETPNVKSVLNLFEELELNISNVIIKEGNISEIKNDFQMHELSLIHIDVDFYQPTFDSLMYLYPNLSIGGIVILNDYGVESLNCKDAVDRFRLENKITSPIKMINQYIGYWIK